MLVINGWQVFAHPLFLDQIEKLTEAVERARTKDPAGFQKTANAKVLAALSILAFETIPSDPTRLEYRQGNTLNADRKHWFRAKFGGQRFRLFFRYNAAARIIILAWVDDPVTSSTDRDITALTDALIAGENSGAPRPFDNDTFLKRMHTK